VQQLRATVVADEHDRGVDADARVDVRQALGGELFPERRDRLPHRESTPAGPERVVLHGDGRTEEADHRVTDVLVEARPLLEEDLAHPRQVAVEDADQPLRIVLVALAEAREPPDVAEEGRDLPRLTVQRGQPVLLHQLVHQGWREVAAESGAQMLTVAAGKEVDRKSTRLNSSHVKISYAVFCLKKKKASHTAEVQTHIHLSA